MKFERSTQITWKREAVGKHKYSLVYNNIKADKCFRCYLFWSLWGRWFIFMKYIINKQPFAHSKSFLEIDVLKKFGKFWKFVKLLKHHFYTFKNTISTEQLRTTASVSIEQNFNIEKPNFNWCREKPPQKKPLCKGLGLRVLQKLFPSVAKES